MSNASLFGPESHPVGDSEFDFSGKKRDPYDPVSIRLRNLDREVTVRTIGLIYLIGAALTVLNTAILLSSDKLMAVMLKAVNPQVLTPETFRTFMMIFVVISSVIMLAFGFALTLCVTLSVGLLAFFANGPLLNFYGFVPVALGGLGNNRGAVIGGLALGIFQQAANFLVGGIFSSVAVFSLFIIVLLIVPQGLFGGHAARRV